MSAGLLHGMGGIEYNRAAGVAHDIKNSLVPLLTYAELLAQVEQFAGSQRDRRIADGQFDFRQVDLLNANRVGVQPVVGAQRQQRRLHPVGVGQGVGPVENGDAAQLGADIELSDKWVLNLDLRYISIEADATLDGADLGKVEINPWVYAIAVGRRF